MLCCFFSYGIVLSDGHVHISEEQDACKKSTQIKLPSPIQEITPSVHVEILDISGARVVRGTTHSSKKNIIELTPVDERIILLQNDDGSTTEAWYQDLISVAGPQKAGSLPRSNSLRVKNIPNSAVGGVNDTTVKHLKNFFGGGKRPSRETLENKGIYKSEPVFGNRLDALCAREAGTSSKYFL